MSETGSNPDLSARNEAFYWTAGGGMFNLRDVLISYGATNLDGWLLTVARGVSADGSTVVGTAISPTGETQAFIATIPEPSTIILAIIAAGGIMILATRHKARRWSATTGSGSQWQY
jgi:hypothetical protein